MNTFINPSIQNHLGIDIGSVSLKLVIVDGQGNLLFHKYHRTRGQPIHTTQKTLQALLVEHGNLKIRNLMITGSGKDLLSQSLQVDTINEIVVEVLRHEVEKDIEPIVEDLFEISEKVFDES